MEIRRDKDGFLTEEQSDEMYQSLPIVVGLDNDEVTFQLITTYNWSDWLADLEKPYKYNCWHRVKYIDSLEKGEAK